MQSGAPHLGLQHDLLLLELVQRAQQRAEDAAVARARLRVAALRAQHGGARGQRAAHGGLHALPLAAPLVLAVAVRRTRRQPAKTMLIVQRVMTSLDTVVS